MYNKPIEGREKGFSLPFFVQIHQKGIICGVAFDHSSLRRIAHTPQSSLLGALHLMPFWWIWGKRRLI